MLDMLINSMGVIFSHCISHLHIVHFKYLKIQVVNYVSKKLKRKKHIQDSKNGPQFI